MCFVIDADWTARVVEEEELVSDGKARCDDCCRRIALGERYDRIDQQEYEECQRCEDTWKLTDEELAEQKDWCKDEGHDYGETFTHRMCCRCKVLRQAISAVEVREGCGVYESQPPYGPSLRESVWESDHREEYADEAAMMDPGLALSGYLDRIFTSKPKDVISDLADDENFDGAWCDRMTAPAEWFDTGGEA